MNPYTAIIAAAGALVALGGCSSSRKTPAAEPAQVAARRPMGEAVVGAPSAAMPRAVIYKTSGDYTDNVPVQIGAGGNITSYPAPSDVSVSRSTPLPLADGFLLDRRGISATTAFTTYTYRQYSALAQPPSPEELKAAIIPGARVTEMYTLAMTPSEAAADTAAVNSMILHDRSALTPVKAGPTVLEYKMKE